MIPLGVSNSYIFEKNVQVNFVILLGFSVFQTLSVPDENVCQHAPFKMIDFQFQQKHALQHALTIIQLHGAAA